jgi:hypothetical protein
MPHVAIIGVTTSGKTHLARSLAQSMRKGGVPTLVLHRPREPWNSNEATWQTSDAELFLSKFWSVKSHACFMELADGAVDKYDLRFHKCFTEGRHEGHRCFYLTQRAATVHPAIRENCASLYLFACGSRAGAKLWSDEFNDDALLKATSLPQWVYYHKANRFSPATVHKMVTVSSEKHRSKKVLTKHRENS